ncbi:hypothetical protein PV11_06292 [Exophiala sideris]|uniref:Uncharacterized protein n=1 Tax=Exophiala sideris TaxID=1016849 RepID=A0A0D1VRI5_9EURO|nr:hypothetical protein PV11_06292 [Exophiala sideris]
MFRKKGTETAKRKPSCPTRSPICLAGEHSGEDVGHCIGEMADGEWRFGKATGCRCLLDQTLRFDVDTPDESKARSAYALVGPSGRWDPGRMMVSHTTNMERNTDISPVV